ncbi:MAG: cytochrome c, partial [Croceibacterium sp.]
ARAAPPKPIPAAASAATIAKGKQVFGNNGCGGCHTLADAGAAGGIGPAFDGNPGLSAAEIFGTIHDGRAAMPSFAGQITDPDIRAVAAYIVSARK